MIKSMENRLQTTFLMARELWVGHIIGDIHLELSQLLLQFMATPTR